MNPTLRKSLMHLKTNHIVLLMLLLVFALAMPLSPSAVLAQDETPTPVPNLPADATDEAPVNPTTEPVDESAAPTETPAEASPTPTEAPTTAPEAADDEIQASAPDWRVEYDLAYTPLQVAYEGGRESLEARLNTYFTDTLSPLGATHQLTAADSAEGAAAYLLTLSGSGGAAQLRQVLQNTLTGEFYFLGGIASLEISGEAHSDANWQLKLDTNITTPFKWQMESNAWVAETAPSDYQHVSNLKGAPGHQVFSLSNTAGGNAVLRLKYAPAWDAARPADRRIYLSAPLNQNIDLSTLIASGDDAVEPPPLSEELADDPDRVWAQGALPANFDWRDYGGVPDVRYQGSCGSCWAFATVGVMESAMLINDAPADLDLSEQFLVSCTLNHNKGCNGGYSDSHKYHVSTLAQQQTAAGAVLEADMPYENTYTKVEAPCQTVNHPYRLAKWYRITSDWTTIPSVETIKHTIYTKGPITVTVCVGEEFHAYRSWSGIFTTNEASTCGSSKINHAVILVGWGTDPTYGTYWILRNSWDTWWGDDGYMYIKAGTSNVGMDATYVEYLPLPDRIAPMVKKIDTSSHTSDNKIVQNEQVGVPVTKLYAVFDEAMNSDSITDPANYSLVNLGADNASGGGDDAAMTINSVTYTASSYTATLNVNGGTALPNASYLLTISGSANVKDKGGNLLDGNGDGIAGGNYVLAFTISVKPPAPLLTSPASKGYTNDQTTQFTWNAVNFAVSYEFQLDDTSNFSSPLIAENVGSNTTYTSALTLPAGKYYWRVFGINRYAAAGATSSRYFTIDITPPPVPVLKSPADAASYKGTPTYTWGTATGARYYQFRWNGESSTSYTSPVLTAAKHKPPTQPLGAYTWQVRAGDLAGNWSDWSSARSLTVIPPIPAAPVLAAPASGFNTTDRSPDLDWNDVDYAVRYEIQVAASSKFSPLLQSNNERTTSTFTPADLADGKYYWRVRAINNNVDDQPQIGKWCSPRSFVVDNIAPLAPVLAAPADGITSKGTPTYSWKAAAGAKYYQFRYLTTPENELIYTSSESTSTRHKPPTQAPGDYIWQVRARDLAGNWGAWSATHAITIIPTVPAAPKLAGPASGSSTSNTTPDLSWNAVAYGHTYEIQIDNSSGFGSPDYNYTDISSTTRTAGPLAAGKWYWRVRAVNTLGKAGAWSSARTITIIP